MPTPRATRAAAPPVAAALPGPTREPYFRLDTQGERIGLAAAAVLLGGALLPWGGPSLWAWGPLDLNAHGVVPLTVAVLLAMQVSSTASLTSNLIVAGLSGLIAAAAVLAKAGSNLATHDPWGLGMSVTLLGAALAAVAMEVQRREAGADYVALARRAVELALKPRVQLALLKLVLPFAIAGGAAFFILEVYGQQVANKLAATFALYWFNPLGKEVGVPFALCPGLNNVCLPALDPALTWSFIVFIDLCTALFFVWNYDHVLKLPYFGRFFAWVERKGNETVVNRPWIGRLAFFGLVIYALLPFEGTGAIGGSVVGRGIGLAPVKTFLAVGLGSVLRTTYTTLFFLGAFSALGL